MAAEFSERIGWLGGDDVARIRELLSRLNLRADPPKLNATDFLAAMSLDKKVVGGEIRLVLLKSIGEAVITLDYPSHELLDVLSERFIH
jgi:3-dehydroquinate synthase